MNKKKKTKHLYLDFVVDAGILVAQQNSGNHICATVQKPAA